MGHSKGIIHGDLKPANILLDANGRCKLCDFGLSRVSLVENHMQSFAGCGTLGYMAPELLHGDADRSISSKIDVYAFGSLCWGMVELKEPFGSDNPSMFWIAQFVTSGKRLPITEPCCPPALHLIIDSCWDNAPIQRPDVGNVVESLNKRRRNMKYCASRGGAPIDARGEAGTNSYSDAEAVIGSC